MTKRQQQQRTDRWKHLQRKVVHPVPTGRANVQYEPMICMDCESIYTTEDSHIRFESRVLCIRCEGMLTLLHQYDADRDECELDVRLKETLDSSL